MNNKHRAAGAFLAMALIAGSFAPLSVSATTVNETTSSFLNYSIEQLQSLIAKLQARLEELKKNAVQCFVTDATLSLGDGEGSETTDVRRLQDFLREKGFFKLKSTGWFGKVTRASLIAFQKENGLAQTGEFDAATKAKAHSLSCTSLPKPKATEKKEDKKKIDEQKGAVTSISMTVNGASVNWTENGYSKNGFKIVWSKNTAPTYPTREGDRYIYLSDPSASSTTIEAFDGSGTYHVRVCEYLGGACGAYSNEATTQL
jgi:peptidoglycan hydrolase-like protein with peptidoglycan-binding domain